jgi:hypothetical protein
LVLVWLVLANVAVTEVPVLVLLLVVVAVPDVALCVVMVTVTIFISGAVTDNEVSSIRSPSDSKAA